MEFIVLAAVYLVVSAILLLVVAWTAGSLFFDVGREGVTGKIAMAVWLVIVAALFLMFDFFVAALVVSVLVMLHLCWWFTLKPSNDRIWDPNFSQLCRIEIDGDDIRVENVRNTEYRTLTDFDLKYENRQYRMSALQGADLIVLFWGSDFASHPMVVFDFGKFGRLCFSVEVRYRKDQSYNIFKGLYRQYELQYVVTDERDAILRRTKFSENQQCYLYRLDVELDHVKQLFQDYVNDANDLADNPRWYHIITQNCTSAVIRHRSTKIEFDLRFYFNGKLDQLMYQRKFLDQSVPFEELKAKSLINDRANLASADNFSTVIRN